MKRSLTILLLLLSASTTLTKAEKLPDKGEMTILAWIGVRGNFNTLQAHQDLKDAGFTAELPGKIEDRPGSEPFFLALEHCRKVGLQMLMELDPETPEETVKKAKDNPALLGYFIADEPPATRFADIAELIARVRSIDKEHICYVNMLPDMGKELLGGYNFKDYIAKSIETLDTKVVSYDFYPIRNYGVEQLMYCYLDTVSHVSREAGLPFWAFALLVEHAVFTRPSLESLRFQVFADLAYGAQGIEYFTYSRPVYNDYYIAPVDEFGNKTYLYDVVKQMNSEIRQLSCVFKGSEGHEVRHFGGPLEEGIPVLDSIPEVFSKFEGNGTHGLLSMFNNDGHAFYLIQNCDLENDLDIDLDFSRPVKRVSKDGALTDASTWNFPYRITPGDIIIFME